MKAPRFTLVADGPTDGDMLIPVLEWLLRIHCPDFNIKVEYANILQRRIVPRSLEQKIAFALVNYPCECLFIHRDAEREPPENRRNEIRRAIESQKMARPATHVCVVPVRMSEAWLLFDEAALRLAAGNPNGRVALEIPRRSAVENLPDPKRLLYDLLTNASELGERRRKTFDSKASSRRLAGLINNFSWLRELTAFQALEADIQQVVKDQGWDTPE